MVARLAATFPAGLAIVRFSGAVSAANAEAAGLLAAHDVEQCPCRATRDAIAMVLARLAGAPALAETHARVRRADRPTLYLAATKIDTQHVGLVVRVEARRDDLMFHALVDRLGLSAPDARLAMRVREGMSNDQIAAAFDISAGAVKTRLSRLFHRLGIRRRADLALLVESVRTTDATRAHAPAHADQHRLDYPAMEVFLRGLNSGLAVLDASDRWIWTNPAAERLKDVVPLASLHAALAGEHGSNAPLRAHTWRVDDALRAVKLDPMRERDRDKHDFLIQRFCLSHQQARIAVQLHSGASSAAIAATHGLRRSTVRVVCSDIYAKLGVRDRTSLVVLLAHVLS